MNSSVKAIEWFEPMSPIESSKKWNAGEGWAPVIMARVLLLPLYLGSGSSTFVFAAMFKECGLSIVELSYLVKPSCFNMSMSVKTIGHLSNKIFDDVEFLMTMYVCEEELSLSGVFDN